MVERVPSEPSAFTHLQKNQLVVSMISVNNFGVLVSEEKLGI